MAGYFPEQKSSFFCTGVMKQKPNLWRKLHLGGCNSSISGLIGGRSNAMIQAMMMMTLQNYYQKKNYSSNWHRHSFAFKHRKIACHILCSIYLLHTDTHDMQAHIVPWFPTDYHHYSNNYYCHYILPQCTTVFPRMLVLSPVHTCTNSRRTFKVSLLNAKWTTPTLCLRTKY